MGQFNLQGFSLGLQGSVWDSKAQWVEKAGGQDVMCAQRGAGRGLARRAARLAAAPDARPPEALKTLETGVQ